MKSKEDMIKDTVWEPNSQNIQMHTFSWAWRKKSLVGLLYAQNIQTLCLNYHRHNWVNRVSKCWLCYAWTAELGGSCIPLHATALSVSGLYQTFCNFKSPFWYQRPSAQAVWCTLRHPAQHVTRDPELGWVRVNSKDMLWIDAYSE